ncbi:hypothetical protein B0H17DRAFT_159990 [Mycena rosella]|uniref:Uncharacterized protein n=1 Tax=Mycena rosella TaxID=1033263 RepID=A0AAD7D1U7_MYCRO|nr:hypothetical protein B0H17DRAFT_159990 [Mycena rosella]
MRGVSGARPRRTCSPILIRSSGSAVPPSRCTRLTRRWTLSHAANGGRASAPLPAAPDLATAKRTAHVHVTTRGRARAHRVRVVPRIAPASPRGDGNGDRDAHCLRGPCASTPLFWPEGHRAVRDACAHPPQGCIGPRVPLPCPRAPRPGGSELEDDASAHAYGQAPAKKSARAGASGRASARRYRALGVAEDAPSSNGGEYGGVRPSAQRSAPGNRARSTAAPRAAGRNGRGDGGHAPPAWRSARATGAGAADGSGGNGNAYGGGDCVLLDVSMDPSPPPVLQPRVVSYPGYPAQRPLPHPYSPQKHRRQQGLPGASPGVPPTPREQQARVSVGVGGGVGPPAALPRAPVPPTILSTGGHPGYRIPVPTDAGTAETGMGGRGRAPDS